MHEGTISTIVPDRGFGFIRTPQQPDTFFHASDLAPELGFDETLRERRVRFSIKTTPKGPRAVGICAAD
jgi:cold shock CspA family protein